MAEGDFEPTWTAEMARKDARLMQAAANGAELPVIDGVEAALTAAIDRGLADKDLGIIAAR
jgi:3-hydroxyisobutyrate dehydrogenase-like beta-hydroxyacid dehydrogenase